MLYDRYRCRIIPTRFPLFGSVGGLGVFVHMAVLSVVYVAMGSSFALGQAVATMVAMTFNFWLNNLLTYRDSKLTGARDMFFGWLKFCATCAVGAFANVAAAALLQANGVAWWLSAIAGVVLASVWNYALSSKFVWGRFR